MNTIKKGNVKERGKTLPLCKIYIYYIHMMLTIKLYRSFSDASSSNSSLLTQFQYPLIFEHIPPIHFLSIYFCLMVFFISQWFLFAVSYRASGIYFFYFQLNSAFVSKIALVLSFRYPMPIILNSFNFSSCLLPYFSIHSCFHNL